jgi:eukaryotic-like serine/threonine-protein kinase
MDESAEGATDTAAIGIGAHIGEIIDGRYHVDEYLGAGGMGEVYAATHLTTRARVALKLLRPMHLANPSVSRRFLREARFETAIKHPNVIQVSDVLDGPDGLPVIVMELLEGESLAARLERKGNLGLDEVVPIFLGVALGLEAAHAKGIVHRDLKPDNVFVLEGPDGVPIAKVLDFGIAKAMDPLLPHAHSYGSSTHHGSVLGTIPYMAYEQAMSEAVDRRADIWAFAVSMVEALSGRRPLHYHTIQEMFTAFLQQDVPSVTTLLPDLPAPLAAALDACLVKKPALRADSLSEVIRALQQPQQLPFVPSPVRRSKRAYWATGIAASAFVCAGWGLWRWHATPVAAENESRKLAVEAAVLPPPKTPSLQVADKPAAAAQVAAFPAPNRVAKPEPPPPGVTAPVGMGPKPQQRRRRTAPPDSAQQPPNPPTDPDQPTQANDGQFKGRLIRKLPQE